MAGGHGAGLLLLPVPAGCCGGRAAAAGAGLRGAGCFRGRAAEAAGLAAAGACVLLGQDRCCSRGHCCGCLGWGVRRGGAGEVRRGELRQVWGLR